MKLYNKILLGATVCAVSLTALYYGALFAIPKCVDLNKYKENIFTTIEKETGYKVSSEDIYFKQNLKPFLKVHLYHTAVIYPDNELFLKLKEVDLQVKLLPLLFKQIVIKDAVITRPVINITLYKDFSTSLEKFAVDKKVIDTKGFNFHSIANESLFKQYKIKFKDETINKTFYLEGDELLLKDIQLNNKAHILVTGSIYEGKKEYIKYDLDLTSALNKREHQFTFSPFKTILETDVKGNIKGIIKADKDNNINGSLKIEDLSLKLNNIVSKDNNANITFKGQEADIDAIFHTSKNDIAKIKGKFAFGKKHYIDFNTNAKNIDLANLYKIISSVSKILNIQNPLNDVKLSGLLNADFNINSDFKKLKSKGIAQITNAEIHHKELPYPIKDINANINFNNNNINIEQAAASINNTPLNIEGSIKEDLTADIKAHADNLDLKAIKAAFISKTDIPFEILNGKVNFISEIKGNLSKSFDAVSHIHISDIKLTERKTKTPLTAKTVNINLITKDDKYNGDITAEDLVSEINKNKITANKFTLLFDDKAIKIPNNEVFYKHSAININGAIKEYNTNPVVNIEFKSDIDANDIGIIAKQYIKAPYKAVGKINTTGKILINKDKQSIKATAKADKDNYISYIVIKELLNKPSIMNIDCEIAGDSINIKDLTLNDITLKSYDGSNKIISVNGEISKNMDFKNLKVIIPNLISARTNFQIYVIYVSFLI